MLKQHKSAMRIKKTTNLENKREEIFRQKKRKNQFKLTTLICLEVNFLSFNKSSYF